MKRYIFAGLAACMVLCGGGVAAQSAQETVAAYYRAAGLGGFADSVSGCYYFQRFDSQGDAVAESEVYIHYPGRYRIEVRQHGQEMIMVFNGDEGWVKAPGEETRELKAEGVKVFKTLYDLFDILMLRDTNLVLKAAGDVKEEGRVFRKVEVEDKTPGSTAPTTYFFFDSETGLLDHTTSQVKVDRKKIKMMMTFRNYERMGDFTLPTEIATSMDGQQEMVIRTLGVSRRSPEEVDGLFSKP